MKILYGIQSLGNGHMARARILAPALTQAGFEIDFLFSGRDSSAYFDMEIFGENCRYRSGFSISFNRGKVKDIDTFIKNRHFQFAHDIATLDLDPYDFVLSDCEPITAWAALLKRKKSVSMSNQCAFKYDIPKYPGFWPSKLLINHLAPANTEIGLHWHHFNQPLLPPIIESTPLQEPIANKILVYMYFEEVRDIVDFLKPFDQYHFSIYANVTTPLDLNHIQVMPYSYEGFKRDFATARGVICNAGFELSSKCLATNKRLMVKPLMGQVEQLSNALALQKLQRATVIKDLDSSVLERWLQGPLHTPIGYPDVATSLARWLAEDDRQSLKSLSTQLWQQTTALPNYVKDSDRKLHFNRIV